FLILILLSSTLQHGTGMEISPLLQLAVVLLIAVLFQPLKEHLQRALDRYVYRRRYDYHNAVRTATRKISGLLDLDSLVQYLCDMTVATFQPERVTVYVRDIGRNVFAQVA